MEFIFGILQSASLAVAHGVFANAARSFGNWLFDHLHRLYGEWRTEEIREFLESLGCTSETDVRELVKAWADMNEVPAATEADVHAVLTNLVRGARFLTTHGGIDSQLLRMDRVLEQLMEEIQPQRKRGEEVTPASPWILERFLGMGTFGEVWLARNRGYPDGRAFKFFAREGAAKWIRAEQRTLASVRERLPNHPNLIQFLDVDLDAKPFPFLALEYADGGSLEDWILTKPTDRAALCKETLIQGLADGLASAHAEGVHHRDLKPANILLQRGPTVIGKIADFGLGLAAQPILHTSASRRSSEAVVVGTGMYLPPEAHLPYFKREPAQDDIFSFGVVWYQLLVEKLERPPYDFAERLEYCSVDSHTIHLISRCLARPEKRFADAQALSDAMMDALPPIRYPHAGEFDVQYLVREYLAASAGPV